MKITTLHLLACALLGQLASAELPVEPATVSNPIKFTEEILTTGELDWRALPLMMTTLQYEGLDLELEDQRILSAQRGLEIKIKELIERTVDKMPRAAVILAPILDRPIRTIEATGRRKIEGEMVIKILSRTGLAPAQSLPDGTRVSHLAIERLGFELRHPSDRREASMVRRAIASVESRKVGVVPGLNRDEVNLSLKPSVRDRLIEEIQKVSAERREEVTVHVHLLDGDKNDYGSYPLDAKTNRELVRDANGQPVGVLSTCRDLFTKKF